MSSAHETVCVCAVAAERDALCGSPAAALALEREVSCEAVKALVYYEERLRYWTLSATELLRTKTLEAFARRYFTSLTRYLRVRESAPATQVAGREA